MTWERWYQADSICPSKILNFIAITPYKDNASYQSSAPSSLHYHTPPLGLCVEIQESILIFTEDVFQPRQP